MLQIVAYQPEIALNLGNMIRTASCFGVPISVVEPCGFPFSLKAMKRSAMDYSEHAEIHRHRDWAEYLTSTQARRVLLTTKSSHSYTEFNFQKGDHVIVGQESAGVPAEVARACDALITIPMPGHGRSLNVSNAAAIVIAEGLRQLGAI